MHRFALKLFQECAIRLLLNPASGVLNCYGFEVPVTLSNRSGVWRTNAGTEEYRLCAAIRGGNRSRYSLQVIFSCR